MITLDQSISLTKSLLALSVVVQSLEWLWIRKTFQEHGIWSIKVLAQDYAPLPKFAQILLRTLLREPMVTALLCLRVAMAALMLVVNHPGPVLVLLVLTLMINFRWRGVYNGGSDYMTVVVLVGLLITLLNPESGVWQMAGLWYIAIHTCASYFIAGGVKWLRARWRSGRALTAFITDMSIYRPTGLLLKLGQRPVLMALTSWWVLTLELLFPLALLSRPFALGFVTVALAFHLANVYVFGLNRFFWAWLATYPALIYCAGAF